MQKKSCKNNNNNNKHQQNKNRRRRRKNKNKTSFDDDDDDNKRVRFGIWHDYKSGATGVHLHETYILTRNK